MKSGFEMYSVLLSTLPVVMMIGRFFVARFGTHELNCGTH